jgi:hydroxymethylglutaryl-CoA synthase
MTINDRIEEVQENAPKVSDMIIKKSYVDYAVYAKYKGKLRMAWMP